jgi:hypothetical protein
VQVAVREFVVTTSLGSRRWQAEDAVHAREQHEDAFPDEQVLSVYEDDAEDRGKSPYERAMDRHDAAIDALNEAEKRAADMVRTAQREAREALAELMRYEKMPGVALPVGQQRRIEEAVAAAKRRTENLGGEGQ